VIPVTQTDAGVFQYVRETSATHAAAPVAAGVAKPESAYVLERFEDRVRVIAHVVTGVDRSLLMDIDSVEQLLDAELRIGVLLAEENQILNGDATGENLRGILNTAGIGSVAKGGAEPQTDAIYRGITTVRLAFHEPTAVVLHPTDWQTIRLTKLADGEYQAAPLVESDPDRLWGLEVISSAVIAQGTALVGAFADGARIYEREEATVAMAEEHSDDFVKNRVSFRGEERIGLAVERPAAFCKVTAL
jgi:HK97 family phage major capsid protein